MSQEDYINAILIHAESYQPWMWTEKKHFCSVIEKLTRENLITSEQCDKIKHRILDKIVG